MAMIKRGRWALGLALLATGCAAPKVDFSQIKKPSRAGELDAYDVFVGKWNWKAEAMNADAADKDWSGTAEWDWVLDRRVLRGKMTSHSQNQQFEAVGAWTWHPKEHGYKWWMFNDWGYPQEGSASYDADSKTWTMPYTSIGLDGTASYGRYVMKVVDSNTLDWHMHEWADALHTIQKTEMKGTYSRVQ